MGSLMYSINCSLDGYSADANGDFSWMAPSEEMVLSHTEDMEDAAAVLYGRRMYESMAVWETDPAAVAGAPGAERFTAVWQATPKTVFSSTLTEPWTERTELEPALTREAVERAKVAGNVTIGGPTLAKSALQMGLVDAVSLVVYPVIVGGGTRVLPGGSRINLRLLGERRFANGAVRLDYAVE
ncbi:dihydrofolate reductase family protein [Arthrobacter sp. zg-Y20]|uniref:dihydrofolate reductase family protein n=1 Tax=unclassified Arthrobacter TaxID=235627 RepID=UPI001D14EE6B|nr:MULTISPECIES: dihydrofolate reductase family protein [unclassified Arthrobacter]MCC3275381.1 dihydrofolate reductase family protein [Arthrobacter sp. zg-Y20]MDK1315540.1 dihydrofolate reductase family protein [Arthrobacter sp. zg.Y20]WIB05955.1 dihydrofolate reductase family protein [Arthrobacter sp. zg-Y20]